MPGWRSLVCCLSTIAPLFRNARFPGQILKAQEKPAVLSEWRNRQKLVLNKRGRSTRMRREWGVSIMARLTLLTQVSERLHIDWLACRKHPAPAAFSLSFRAAKDEQTVQAGQRAKRM